MPATTAAMTVPSIVISPMKPEAEPRCSSGTRSGIRPLYAVPPKLLANCRNQKAAANNASVGA
jgi:hypothetical protein